MSHLKYFFITITFISCAIFLNSQPIQAGEDSFTQKDRELLIRLDERLNQIDKRFEQIEKRFEQIDKRFEQVDIRMRELREDINKRFESLTQIMIGIIGAFAAIVAVTISFALWDRRTMIRPFESKVKEIEDNILKDRKRVSALIKILKEMAEEDPKLASLLKNFSLL